MPSPLPHQGTHAPFAAGPYPYCVTFMRRAVLVSETRVADRAPRHLEREYEHKHANTIAKRPRLRAAGPEVAEL